MSTKQVKFAKNFRCGNEGAYVGLGGYSTLRQVFSPIHEDTVIIECEIAIYFVASKLSRISASAATRNALVIKFAQIAASITLTLPLFIFMPPAQAAASRNTHGHLSLHTCQLTSPDGTHRLQAHCATLSVPENRAKPRGKHIALHLAVLRARKPGAAKDPLFFIAGGPGQAAMQDYVPVNAAFELIRNERDIVLVDQRGTGQSHPLDCPSGGRNVGKLTNQQQVRWLSECRKHLDANPRFYTTTVAVKDLDAVRAALGYHEINLYGISYGTRVALEYLREFPKHTRTVVLDGVVPPTLALGPMVSVNAQRALNMVFRRCRTTSACRKAFPRLRTAFQRLNRQLTARPAKLTLRDPLTAKVIHERFNHNDFAGAVRLLSYETETTSLLPLLIHAAGVKHHLAPLAAQALMVSRSLSSDISYGMHMAVICTEDVPFYRDTPAERRAMKNTYLGDLQFSTLKKVCQSWPRGVMSKHFKDPVVSGKPVLLISGQADPITPPHNAALVAKSLSNSRQIVVPGQGHGNAWRGCMPKIIQQFIASASVKTLDTSCVKKIKPAPFFVRFTGPEP
jgi:pimeloyl-ACP methyl ester carboxylesterase